MKGVMIEQARLYTEYFDEDAQQWFFYNTEVCGLKSHTRCVHNMLALETDGGGSVGTSRNWIYKSGWQVVFALRRYCR
jgi:hypothetical protein